jgi:hypothetical protein
MSEMHQRMSIEQVSRELNKLHGEVIGNWGRIEIPGSASDGSDACVLISRAELECLERALEIFCETPAGQDICKELEGIANRSMSRSSSNAATFALNDGGSYSPANRQAL